MANSDVKKLLDRMGIDDNAAREFIEGNPKVKEWIISKQNCKTTDGTGWRGIFKKKTNS